MPRRRLRTLTLWTCTLLIYDYKARFYDPLHGRFQQRDRAEFGDTYNLYEYAQSRVTVLPDPTGDFSIRSFSISFAICSGVSALNIAAELLSRGMSGRDGQPISPLTPSSKYMTLYNVAA